MWKEFAAAVELCGAQHFFSLWWHVVLICVGRLMVVALLQSLCWFGL